MGRRHAEVNSAGGTHIAIPGADHRTHIATHTIRRGKAATLTRRETMTENGGDQAKERVGQLYERYASSVTAYAMRRTSDCDVADVVAETFLVAWRRRDEVPEEPRTLPWLYGVARRVLANQRRSQRRRSRLRDRLSDELTDYQQTPPALEDMERVTQITAAMERLSTDDAEILRLAAWEDLTPSEISVVMAIAPGTARQRIRRARIRLRKQLAADGIVLGQADAFARYPDEGHYNQRGGATP